MEKDQADLGLVSYPQSTRTIEAIPWREEPMVLVCAPEHRLASCDAIRHWRSCRREVVGFDTDLTIRREIDRVLAAQASKCAWRWSSTISKRSSGRWRSTRASALLPEPTVVREVAAGALVARRWPATSSCGRSASFIAAAKNWARPPAFMRLLLKQPFDGARDRGLGRAGTGCVASVAATTVADSPVRDDARYDCAKRPDKPSAEVGSGGFLKAPPRTAYGRPGAFRPAGRLFLHVCICHEQRNHNDSRFTGLPEKQGLYDPAYEKDSCGVGFIAHIKGVRSH